MQSSAGPRDYINNRGRPGTTLTLYLSGGYLVCDFATGARRARAPCVAQFLHACDVNTAVVLSLRMHMTLLSTSVCDGM